jgi:hypothetical protein
MHMHTARVLRLTGRDGREGPASVGAPWDRPQAVRTADRGSRVNLDCWPDLAAWTPDDWSAFGTNVTFFIAVGAGLLAWRQLHEARKRGGEQAQP